MATWTVFPHPVRCGACGREVPADAPVQLLTAKQLRRCEVDATAPVNWVEVDLERARLEMDRERAALRDDAAIVASLRRPPFPQTFRPLRDLPLPFDAKAAACGRED